MIFHGVHGTIRTCSRFSYSVFSPLSATMGHLVISNMTKELTSDCSWTDELVSLSYGDLYVDGQAFATYIAACYPETQRPPQFIINVVDGACRPILSIPFEVRQSLPDPVLPISAGASPWSEDGVLIGPIPDETDRLSYTQAIETIAVAKELATLEGNLAQYTVAS